jgi:cysteine-rich repeat protein
VATSSRTLRAIRAALALGLALTSPCHAACRGGAPNHIREPGEQCDSEDTGPYLCQHFCMTAGQVHCAADCTVDTSACEGCGNARIDPGEVCDGATLGGGTCAHGGTIRCAADCRTWDRTGCFGCGNGRREGSEQCDGNDVGSALCNRPGDTGGVPGCQADCTLDYATCWRCGNGRVDPGEQCDDDNTVALDGCGADCRLECGDGIVEANEECDDANQAAGDGCNLCGLEAVYDGGGGDLRECAVEWGVSGPPAPTATITCTDGAACDRDATAGQCTFRVFHCFNRAELGGGGPPPCTPANVSRVELVGASLSGAGALGTAGQDAILGAMAATLRRSGATVVRTGARLDVTPAASTPRLCGLFLLPVPAGADRVVALKTTDSAGAADNDQLTLRCVRP